MQVWVLKVFTLSSNSTFRVLSSNSAGIPSHRSMCHALPMHFLNAIRLLVNGKYVIQWQAKNWTHILSGAVRGKQRLQIKRYPAHVRSVDAHCTEPSSFTIFFYSWKQIESKFSRLGPVSESVAKDTHRLRMFVRASKSSCKYTVTFGRNLHGVARSRQNRYSMVETEETGLNKTIRLSINRPTWKVTHNQSQNIKLRSCSYWSNRLEIMKRIERVCSVHS